MSKTNLHITADSPANAVLNAILADGVRYPCLSAMTYRIAETLSQSDPGIASQCWSELNLILSGQADPASVRRFISLQAPGRDLESAAFRRALMFLVDEDEMHRTDYAALDATSRKDFVAQRLRRAESMNVPQSMAL